MKDVDSLMHYVCVLYTKSIHISKFQVNTVTHIEVLRQNVFSHARITVIIGVAGDLKCKMENFIISYCTCINM